MKTPVKLNIRFADDDKSEDEGADEVTDADAPENEDAHADIYKEHVRN